MMIEAAALRPAPRLPTVLAVSLVAITAMGILRFSVFPDDIVPLSYALVLLLVLWHRDLRVMWATAAVFMAMAAVKMLVVLPDTGPTPRHAIFMLMQWANIVVTGGVLHGILVSRRALHDANHRLTDANLELEASNEELAAREEEILRQNEELQNQAEELEQQAEELEQQAEETQAQSDDLRELNLELSEREATLATLLRLAQSSQDEQSLLDEICATAMNLLGGHALAACLFELQGEGGLVVRAHCGLGFEATAGRHADLAGTLAEQVIKRQATAHVPDLAERPDLHALASLPEAASIRSILSAPVRLDEEAAGVLEIYAAAPTNWTDRQADLLAWLSRQCGQAWSAVRLRDRLRERTREAERQAALIRTLMDHVPDGITIAEAPDVTIRAVSRYGLDLLGRESHRLIGIPQEQHPERWQVYHPDGQTIARHDELPLTRATVKGEQVRDEEWVLVRGDGRQIPILCNAAPIRDASGAVTGGVIAWRDIGDLKRIQNLLTQRESQLREANEHLEAIVAERTAELESRHADLKRLATELTTAEQRERRRIAQVLHDDLQQLLVAARMRLQAPGGEGRTGSVLSLIDQALESSRSLTTELSPPVLFQEAFGTSLRWLARRMEQQHGLLVTVDDEPGAEPPTDDWRVFLFTAVGEALFNVVKHAGVKRAGVSLRREDGTLRVTVTDSGAGFQALERATSGDAVGGFGLFSIRERIGLMGGYARVASRVGEGTRVELVVPLSPEIGADTQAALSRSVAHTSQTADGDAAARAELIRVMLADDHDLVREGIAHLLREAAEVELLAEARDGAQAIALVEEHRPDVVVMDINMPVMDGIEATRVIRGRWPDVRVIGMTMHSDPEVLETMRRAGAAAVVTKDAQTRELLDAIRTAVASPSGRA